MVPRPGVSLDSPFPTIQNTKDWKADFVRDDNSDNGAWDAQNEYARLEKRLAEERRDVAAAQDARNQAKADVLRAQAKAADAERHVSEAEQHLTSMRANVSVTKMHDLPSTEKTDAVPEASKGSSVEAAKLEERHRDLAAARRRLAELLNRKKGAEHNVTAAQIEVTKIKEAEEDEQQKKQRFEEELERAHADHQVALKAYESERAELDQAKADLESAEQRVREESEVQKSMAGSRCQYAGALIVAAVSWVCA